MTPSFVLDLRTDPDSDRDQAVLAASESLAAGLGFVLASDHDPELLRRRLHLEHPGVFSWSLFEQGPGVWRAVVVRTAVAESLAPLGGDAA
jgi:uncharacterized protein (DUF2249 family)